MSVVYELIFEQKEMYSITLMEDDLAYEPDDKVLCQELYGSFEAAKARLKSLIAERGLDVNTFKGTVRDNFVSVNNINEVEWYDLQSKLNAEGSDAFYIYYQALIQERSVL